VTEATPETQSTPSVVRRIGRLAREWGILLVVAVVLSVGVRSVGFQTFYIPSGSMEPTLQIGDRIVVNKLSVEFGTVHTGDIIVFRATKAVAMNCGDHDTDLVKRVIGVPGDRIRSSGNTILVNGVALAERWPHTEPLGPVINPVHVPKGEYYVMGDNHSDSCDSRYWGLVPHKNIIGKVFVRIWPFGRIGWL